MYNRRQKNFPCDSYGGNMCSGFGGETICYSCGWDMYEHERGTNTKKEAWLAQDLAKQAPRFEAFLALHPDIEFTIKYNEYMEWWEFHWDQGYFPATTDSREDLESVFQAYKAHYEKEKNG